MKTTTEKQHIKIPIELFLDVCKMIRTGNLNNKITGSNEATGEVLLELSFSKGNKIQNDALQNIYESVSEWNEQRYGDENPDEIALN
ncbi:MAG: hypothetical protein HY062_02010 [Bacteroidetes bacterium]|nr:hypothetical protein [Bacteroidota bacterium]